MKILHPIGLVLDTLVEAGVPHSRVHAVAEQIKTAYEEINRPRPRPAARAETAAESAGRP